MRSRCTVLLPTVLAVATLSAGAGTAAAAPDLGPTAATPPVAAAAVVKGEILARYRALGGVRSFLGRALTDELSTPARAGRYNVFQGGSIYWSAATGAWEVHGDIRTRWASLGYENSVLGFPTTNEVRLAARGGAFNRFEGGQVYWSGASGAHTVLGDIFEHWGTFGYENGPLGYPVTDELPTPNRPGAFNAFEGGSSIYWSPDTGAVQVGGAIRDKWRALGYEDSALGFPTLDEVDGAREGERLGEFESGVIQWSPAGGARVTGGVGVVTALDLTAQELTIADLQETYAYGDEGDAYLVVAADGDAQEITEAEFLARVSVGTTYVSVSTDLDPSAPSSFALLEELEPGATVSPAQRQRAVDATRR